MDIIPFHILSLLQTHLQVLLYWFSDEMYRRLLARSQTHFLMRLAGQLDFAALERACSGYHHHTGPGAPVVHTVPRLVRALLVKYLLDHSLRELEQAIHWNLLVKWFVGKSHADVARATEGRTQLVAPLRDYSPAGERLGPDDFTLSPDSASLTCPNGAISVTAYRSQSGEGRVFRFSAHQCQGCPLAQACRGDKLSPDRMRQVFISDHRSSHKSTTRRTWRTFHLQLATCHKHRQPFVDVNA